MNKTIQPRTFDEEKVKKDFARASVTYDWWAKATESKAAEKVLEFVELQKNESILEVGVGTGLLFQHLLEKNREGFTAGLDLSPDMIKKAKDRSHKFDGIRNYSLQQASAYELPFDDQTFNYLISNYMLDLLPEGDFARILRELNRVVKPAGRLVLSSMTFGWKWYQKIWQIIPAALPEILTQCRPIDLVPFVSGAGFKILEEEYISQNTFPSQVLLAIKP